MAHAKRRLSTTITTLLLTLTLTARPAYAQDWGGCVRHGDVATLQCIEVVFYSIFTIILAIVGIAAFIMIFVAGFNLLTSSGDPKKTETASRTLTMAVTGLAAALFVWYALQFLSNFTGVDKLLDFSISIN